MNWTYPKHIIYTVHSESIQTPFTFFNFVMLQPDTTNFFLINLYSVPHNDKQDFKNVCKFIKKKKLKNYIYISI